MVEGLLPFHNLKSKRSDRKMNSLRGSNPKVTNNGESSGDEDDVKLLLTDEVLAPSNWDGVEGTTLSNVVVPSRVRRPIPVKTNLRQTPNSVRQRHYERSVNIASRRNVPTEHPAPGFFPSPPMADASFDRPTQNFGRALTQGPNPKALEYERFNPATSGFMKLSTGKVATPIDPLRRSAHALAPPPARARTNSHTPISISTKDISQAIPKNASCVFHVLDRRVNFDAHPSDASMYSLLRSWVQDDPYRQIPPHSADPTEYSDAKARYPYISSLSRAHRRQDDSQAQRNGMHDEVDTLYKLAIAKTVSPSFRVLRKDLVTKARRAKKELLKLRSVRTAAARESLKRRGIIL